VNFDRLDLGLDEAVVVVGAVLVKVSLSLLLPLWRERFDQPAMELTTERNQDEISVTNKSAGRLGHARWRLEDIVAHDLPVLLSKAALGFAAPQKLRPIEATNFQPEGLEIS
jgi:hypothetical protein